MSSPAELGNQLFVAQSCMCMAFSSTESHAPRWQLCAAVKFFYVKLSFPIGGFLRITRNIIIKHHNLRQFKCHEMYEIECYIQNAKCRHRNVMENMTQTQLNGVLKIAVVFGLYIVMFLSMKLNTKVLIECGALF